jgi:hypothetical protein
MTDWNEYTIGALRPGKMGPHPPRQQMGPPAPQHGALLNAMTAAETQTPDTPMRPADTPAVSPDSLLAEALFAQKRADYYRTRQGGGGLSGAVGQGIASFQAQKYEREALEKFKQAYAARDQLEAQRQRSTEEQQTRQTQQTATMYRQAYPDMSEAEAMLRATGKSIPSQGSADEFQKRQRYGQQMGLQGENLQQFVLTGKYGEEEAEDFNFDDSAKLRTEFNRETQGFAEVTDAYGRIQASIEEPSAAGDLALIFNYMKILDPGSTVREGEFATAQNSAGVPDRMRAQYNSVINGQRLGDTQRKDFADRSTKLYRKAVDLYQGRRGEYHNLARRLNFDPEQIFIERQILGGKPVSLVDPTPDAEAQEGTVIHNPETGETLVLRNGQWVAQ